MKEQPGKKSLKLFISISLVLMIIASLLAVACSKSAETTNPVTTAPVASTVQPIKLVLTSHEAPGGTYQTGFFDPWIAELEKRTNGKVKIEAHFGGELVSISDAYDAAVNGTVDIAWFLNAMVTDKFPMEDVVDFAAYDKINYKPSTAIYQLYQKFPEMQNEYKDVKLIFLGATFMTTLATTKKAGPITTLEQNKGKKMAGAGKWIGLRGEALGHVIASMPPQDVYTSLQKGVIDGGPLGTLFILKDFGWGDVLPYVTRVRTNSSPSAMVMNKNTWNKLPKDVQDVFDGMLQWSIEMHDQFQIKVDKDLYAELPGKFGTQFFELTKEEAAKWNAVDQPVRQAYIKEMTDKGLPGQALMDEWVRLENLYSTPPQ